MQLEPELKVTLRGAERLELKVSTSVPLRRVERALHIAGVAAELSHAHRSLSAPASELEVVLDALGGWTMTKAPEVEELRARRADGESWTARARAVVERLSADPETAAAHLSDYPLRERLDPHQVVAVAIASHPDVRGICIFDEQGLGKTVEALFSFDRLRQNGMVDRALVFAPKNMVLEWVHDAQRFFLGRYKVQALVGEESTKRAALDAPADIYVTNFETAVGLTTRLRQFLQAENGRSLLVVDESFFVKNAKARRAQAVRKLRAVAGRCVVLCGTPAPNSAGDLVEQFNIADGGVAFEGVALQGDAEQDRRRVGEAIERRGVYIRRLKGDVLRLPERTFNKVFVRLEPVQRAAYKAALEGLVNDVASTDEGSFGRQLASFAGRRAMLLQLCSNPASVLPDYAEVPAKAVALDSILSELIEGRGEKVVLWSYFTRSLGFLFDRYGRYRPVRIDGTVPDVQTRREAVRRFQEDPETMLFVGNPAAAGAGLTLHRARFAIYESMSNQAAHYLQSLDRIHRRGQDRPVEYVVLLCDETIELNEFDRLIRKEKAAQELLGDEVRAPVTREVFLAELEQAARLLGTDDGGVHA